MTCQHCCGAESIFDKKNAEKNYRRYKRKGPNKTTRALLRDLEQFDLTGKTLLDIGGGIGVIQHELIRKGVKKTLDVDASSSYIAQNKQLMKENGTEDKMSFIYADFVDVHDKVEAQDIVTLERVVCCYPDFRALITDSTNKANEYYGIIYPLDTPLSRLLIRLTHIYFWFKKNPFRTFVHPETEMQQLIMDQGFEAVHIQRVFPWKVALYKRK